MNTTPKIFFSAFFLFCLFLFSGCSTPIGSVAPADIGEEPRQLYKAKTAEGSLWPQGADKNGLFADSKGSKVGDIVTILIAETSTASKQANTTTSKDSSENLNMTKIFGLGSNMGITDFLGSGNPLDPSLTTSNKEAFKGAGSTSRSDRLTATMTAVITEILPSGNLQIEGKRVVKVNNEKQTLVLTGVIRPVDVAYDNTISSTLIANAEIQYEGKGVLADKQRVGWGTRILDLIWPF